MAKFNIYTFQFSPITTQTNLFDSFDYSLQERMQHKHDIFNDVLRNNDLTFSYRNKTYSYRLLHDESDIYVFKIANRKSVVLERDFCKTSIDNAPSLFVIIDNRTDFQRILIEDDIAFSDTSVIQNILLNSFKSALSHYGLSIKIEKEYDRSEFWKIVDDYPQSITMVRFKISYPNLPRISQRIHELLKETSENVNSHNTSLELKADPGEVLILSHNDENLKDLNNASADSGCITQLKVNGFRSYVSTGKTTKSVEIENLEVDLTTTQLMQILEGIK